MAKLWFVLSPENRRKLAEFYQEQFGKRLRPPVEERCEVQAEVKGDSPNPERRG